MTKRFAMVTVSGALALVLGMATERVGAESITALDGQNYADVRDVTWRPGGLYFVMGSGGSVKGVTIPFTNLTEEVKEKYHYEPYDIPLAFARQNRPLALTKNLAFSMDQLEAAKKKAQAEKKLMGFIMVWDSFFVPSYPMHKGGNSALAHFYDVFHDNLVLVFVRHENELDKVPGAVRTGFFGPDEGGFAPNMAVVSADCSEFVCEIPYGGTDSNGQIREQIYRQKIGVINQFKKAHDKPASKPEPRS